MNNTLGKHTWCLSLLQLEKPRVDRLIVESDICCEIYTQTTDSHNINFSHIKLEKKLPESCKKKIRE